MKATVTLIVIGASGTVTKETGGIENKRKRGDHSKDSIIKIGQNTKKNPEDIKRLDYTSTEKISTNASVKNSQSRKKNDYNF